MRCRVRLKPDGTRWRTGGEVKGKLANGVGSQYSHTTSEHGVSSITNADAHISAASSRLNWRPCRFKWTRPFRRETKSGFCACAVTFQTRYTAVRGWVLMQMSLDTWCSYYKWRYIIKFKSICLLLIHFVYLFNARNMERITILRACLQLRLWTLWYQCVWSGVSKDLCVDAQDSFPAGLGVFLHKTISQHVNS